MFNTEAFSAVLVAVGTALAIGVLVFVVGLTRRLQRSRRPDVARQETERQLTALVKGVTDYAIYMIDPDGRVASWNAGAERLKGYAADEIIGQHFSRFYTDEDRAKGLPQKALLTALKEGKYEAEGWRMRKDGTRFFANVVIDALHDSTGRFIGYAKITRDVTEKLHQLEALAEAQAALAQSQKMEAVGQLSGGIAHDFNNLLHVILNATEVLSRKLQSPDEETKQLLAMIRKNANRAASLTQRLLAFSRRQSLEPRTIDPNRLIRGMTDLLDSAVGESVSVETVLGAEVGSISVDANQLETSILNLAVNARDAMPEGGILTIETTNAFLDTDYATTNKGVTPGQYVMIAVGDTGTGMSDEVIGKAFEPFFTTKEIGEGTGLGLSQVYGFITQSGGHVKLCSEIGLGTTVKLYLPRLAMRSETPAVQRDVQLLPRRPTQKSILLVEDEADVRQFTTRILRDLGYRVTTASNARSALAAMDKMQELDLLFTDVGLPEGMNGRQLANEAIRRRPALKVLLVTGYARNGVAPHDILQPSPELIMKPFTQASIARKLTELLGQAIA